MAERLRILMLEDRQADAELIQFELEEEGFNFTAKVVMTEEEYLQELLDSPPDIILSDYDLPRYDGAQALAEARKQCPEVPFILVTGAITEDRAIAILTGGAKDYVMKNRLQRLAPAVRRVLTEVEEHEARKKAEWELREAHKNLEIEVEKRTAELRAEIEERKRVEEDLNKANRTLRALSKTNQALMYAAGEVDYLKAICRVIVEDCGYEMVWVGYAGQDADLGIRPVAHAGREEGYLETLHLTWTEAELGQVPTSIAIRTGKPCTCNVMEVDPAFAPWREEAKKRGYVSSLCLPLYAGGQPLGAINIYAGTPAAFSEDEVRLLTELADDLTYGITFLRMRENRALAEARISRQTAILAGINRIFWSGLTSRSEEELGVVCMDVAEEITNSRFGFINEIGPEGLRDIAISKSGKEACSITDEERRRNAPGNFKIHGIYGQVLQEGQSFITNDPKSHPDSIGTPPGHPPIRSFLGVPLMIGTRVTGMIGMANREGGYTREQLEALEALAPVMAEAFSRRRSEEEARFLGGLLEEAERPFAVAYPNGRLGRFNRAYEELTGYSREELKTIDWSQTLTPPEWRDMEQTRLEELDRTGEPVRYEKEYIRKDGTRVPVELLVHVKCDDRGRPLFYYSFLTDLTTRKQTG
ncbi:MAG: GAF domain-containing protein [Syntrophales bacterium]|nr:GAF domain-containing protein [Syntrophales bacterium]